jgi:homoserine O-acetyltransferase
VLRYPPPYTPFVNSKSEPVAHPEPSQMKKQTLLVLLLVLIPPQTLRAQDTVLTPKAPESERHEFVIPNFKTESGATLPQARVIYRTYGHLNAAKDNVVLLPSHYMADSHGYEWLIGSSPNLGLDPAKLFLVATELFGNGHSSSLGTHGETDHSAEVRDL